MTALDGQRKRQYRKCQIWNTLLLNNNNNNNNHHHDSGANHNRNDFWTFHNNIVTTTTKRRRTFRTVSTFIVLCHVLWWWSPRVVLADEIVENLDQQHHYHQHPPPQETFHVLDKEEHSGTHPPNDYVTFSESLPSPSTQQNRIPKDHPTSQSHSHSPPPIIQPPNPFFVVSTVDGSIRVLDAINGNLVSGFPSGNPLVGPSQLLNGGRRIVPYLDGQLYVSMEDGLFLYPLEITVLDVLQTPVKTCHTPMTPAPPTASASTSSSSSSSSSSSTTTTTTTTTTTMDDGRTERDGGGSQKPGKQQRSSASSTSCGIVTATKSTTLFALDARTGRLVWQQSPDGTTILTRDNTASNSNTFSDEEGQEEEGEEKERTKEEYDDYDTFDQPPPAAVSTVLLQREDILVQQVSTDSGESVWNVTLGTVQALEFGEGNSAADGGSLPAGNTQGFLPSSGNDNDNPRHRPQQQILMPQQHEYMSRRPVALPSVVFGQDGTSLKAIGSSGTILWDRDFGTVVSSVFGLQDKTWKPLTVLEDPSSEDGSTSSSSSSSSSSSQLLDDDQSNDNHSDNSNNKLVVYNPPFLQQLYFLFKQPASFLDQIANDWFHATGQYGRKTIQQHYPNIIHPSHKSKLQLGSTEHYIYYPRTIIPKKQTMTPLLHHDFLALPHASSTSSHQLTLPGSASTFTATPTIASQATITINAPTSLRQGVFLTWPFIFAICIVAAGVAALIFRYMYMQKKTKWMQLLHQMARDGLELHQRTNRPDTGTGGATTSIGDSGESASGDSFHGDPVRPSFQRSHSLPDTALLHLTKPIPNKRRLRSESLQAHHTADGRLIYDQELANQTTNSQETGNKEYDTKRRYNSHHPTLPTVPSSGNTATSPQEKAAQEQLQPQQQQQQQGVGFVIDGIPLVRYNRYSSEFTEVVALGKGGFGTVVRCRNVLDGREYAIKKIVLKYNTALPLDEFRQRLQRTLREVKSLALLDHKHIVRYYTAWLELQQDQEKGSSKGFQDVSQRLADSEYDLLSPTSTNLLSKSSPYQSKGGLASFSEWTSKCTPSNRRPSLEGRPYIRNSYKNQPNPLGGWSDHLGQEESSFPRCMATVPTALDDYGFTFERSEGDESQDAAVTPWSTSAAAGGTLSNPPEHSSENRQSVSFSAVSPHNSSGGFESSIEASSQNDAGSWSQENRASTTTNNKRVVLPDNPAGGGENESTTKGRESTSSMMVKHILYIQMQFCSQKTLADFLGNAEARKGGAASGDVDVPYALSLFLQIAKGVEHVHGQGLIHRDLKPNNCFIDDSGAVKVGDFGLSRASSNDTRDCCDYASDDEAVDDNTLEDENDDNDCHNSNNKTIREITAGVGTRSYASPEQMEGSDYDSSTDIYSLGIILFELCYPMYTGMERTIVLSKLRNHVFPDQWMETIKPQFPKLHSLLQSMISNSPSDRPTAGVVVRSIQSILEAFTISSLDKNHHESSILLRVEAKPREDVLRHTMELVKEAALPECIEIIQYGLRGGTMKAVMEFAISSSTCRDRMALGQTLVSRLEDSDDILLIRQVLATKYA